MSDANNNAQVELRIQQGDTIMALDPEPVDVEGVPELEFEKLSDRKINFGEMAAIRYLEMDDFEEERKVYASHVQRLFDRMNRGTFNPDSVTIVSAQLGNKLYKVNSQHTAWAVLSMCDKDKKFALQNVREIQYKVKNQQQLRQLYATWDAGKPRTASHLTGVHLAGIEELSGIPGSVRHKLIPAYKLWKLGIHEHSGGASKSRYAPEDIAAMIKADGLDAVATVGKFLMGENHSRRHIVKSGAIAAMLETFSKAKKKSIDFWQPVCDGIGLDNKTDARYVLREYLAAATNRSDATMERSAGRSRKTVNAEGIYRICVYTYNRWLANEPVRKLQIPSERPRAN